VHDETELSSSDLTEAGTQIDLNDEHLWNAWGPISGSVDPDSNVNDESDVHNEKELRPRNANELGREIDVNDEQQ
jgi:hypothetical protein